MFDCEFCDCHFFSLRDYDAHLFVFTRGKALHYRIKNYLRDWAYRIDFEKWPQYMKDYSSRCDVLNRRFEVLNSGSQK